MPPNADSAIVGYLAGPTASGKSALGIELAQRNGWCVISADSMQVYRGMAVGTGSIEPEERQGVPHHLVGVADPRDDFHAARFVREARAAIDGEWHENKRRSLIVGGTGLWIEALREGIFAGPGRDEGVRETLRARLATEGLAALAADLGRIDPQSAARIPAADANRIMRALEVWELSGRRLSEWLAEDMARRAALPPMPPLVVLDPPKEILNGRINRRVDAMLAAGWMDEARALFRLGLPGHSPAGKALGYRELFAVMEGQKSLAEAREAIQLGTRQYAKRQRVWFKVRRGAMLMGNGELAEVEKAIAKW